MARGSKSQRLPGASPDALGRPDGDASEANYEVVGDEAPAVLDLSCRRSEEQAPVSEWERFAPSGQIATTKRAWIFALFSAGGLPRRWRTGRLTSG